MWQKCPACEGTGKKPNPEFLLEKEYKFCDACKGACIINELTGLPPTPHSEIVSRKNSGEKDFRDANMESQQEYFGN